MAKLNSHGTTATTQAQALRWLIDNSTNAPADVIEAAERLYTAKTKRYNRPKVASKAARENAALVPVVVALVENAGDELVNATFISNHIDRPEVRSAQKARAIADMAISNGDLVKYTYKGRTYYATPGNIPGFVTA